MAPKVDLKTKQLQQLCEKYNVKELYLFGSATTDDISDDSDLDFIVKFNRRGFEEAFDQFIDFKQDLEQIYGRSVDLYYLNLQRYTYKGKPVKKLVEIGSLAG